MLNFRLINTNDKALVEKYVPEAVKQICDFTFGNLYCWSENEHTEICEKDGFLYIRFNYSEFTSYVFPWGEGDINKALYDIEEDARARGKEPAFFCVSEEQVPALENYFKDRLSVKENRDYFDYIYSSDNLASLSGRRYHSKKNHVNAFVKKYEISFEKISNENIEECKEFSHKWFADNESNSSLNTESRVIDLALENYDEIGFYGYLLRVDGKIIAFCLGEEMCDGETFCVHFEKADSSYRTAYAVLNKLFAEKLSKRYKYINREDDVGVEGLRKAKLSYNPEYLVKKYYAKVL